MQAAQPDPIPAQAAPTATGPYECPPPFRIEVKPDREAVRVCPVGDVDLATADRLRAQIDELVRTGIERVILDLREVSFLDSAGVHVLIDADSCARADGWQLLLVKPPWNVARVIELVGLDERLRFVEA
jgi:anti-sigma B factor antagonist